MGRSRMVGEPSSLTRPFWDATRNRELHLQWCTDCDAPVHRPRERCPHCSGSALTWRPSTGTGTVYAVSVQHRSMPVGPPGDAPYAVVLVDLDDGVRLMSNIVGIAPDAVTVGDRVQVTWEPLADGRHLPQFEPVP